MDKKLSKNQLKIVNRYKICELLELPSFGGSFFKVERNKRIVVMFLFITISDSKTNEIIDKFYIVEFG